jgi:hypothetical protein
MNAFDQENARLHDPVAAWTQVLKADGPTKVDALVTPYGVAIPQLYWRDGDPRKFVVAGSKWTKSLNHVLQHYCWHRPSLERFDLWKRAAWEPIPESVLKTSGTIEELCKNLHKSNPARFPSSFYVLTGKNSKRNAQRLFDYWANSEFRHQYVKNEGFDWKGNYDEAPAAIRVRTGKMTLRYAPVKRPREKKAAVAPGGKQKIVQGATFDAIEMELVELESAVGAVLIAAGQVGKDLQRRAEFVGLPEAVDKLVDVYIPWPEAVVEHGVLKGDLKRLTERTAVLAEKPMEPATLTADPVAAKVRAILNLPTALERLQESCELVEDILFDRSYGQTWDKWAREFSSQTEHPEVVRAHDVVEGALRMLFEYGTQPQRTRLEAAIAKAIDRADSQAHPEEGSFDAVDLISLLLFRFAIPSIPNLFGDLAGPRSLYVAVLTLRAELTLVRVAAPASSAARRAAGKSLLTGLRKHADKDVVDEFKNVIEKIVGSESTKEAKKLLADARAKGFDARTHRHQHQQGAKWMKSLVGVAQIYATVVAWHEFSLPGESTTITILKGAQAGAMTVQTVAVYTETAHDVLQSLWRALDGNAPAPRVTRSPLPKLVGSINRYMGAVGSIFGGVVAMCDARQSFDDGKHVLAALQLFTGVASIGYGGYMLLPAACVTPLGEALLLAAILTGTLGTVLAAAEGDFELPGNKYAAAALLQLAGSKLWGSRATAADRELLTRIQKALGSKVPLALWLHEKRAASAQVNPPGSTYRSAWEKREIEAEEALCGAGWAKRVTELLKVQVAPREVEM